MEPVQLRLCDRHDIPQITEVALQSYREHYLYLWTEDRYAQWYMDRSFSEESLGQQMQDLKAVFYLILHHHSPVGFLKLNLNKPLEGGDKTKSVELERIYLLKAASGKGIGSSALTQIISLLKRWKKEIIWLKSMDSSPSVHFYQKMGFRKVGEEWLPFKGFKEEYRNMVVMTLELSQTNFEQ